MALPLPKDCPAASAWCCARGLSSPQANRSWPKPWRVRARPVDLRNISAWSIRNPIVPIVLFVALMLMGVFSFMRMDGQPGRSVSRLM